MTRIDDALIDRLAHAEAPRAYTFEVKAMALEIFERRAAERAQAPLQGTGQATGLPFPRGVYP